MSSSKFDELVEILSKDYEETGEYLKRNCAFINQLTEELSKYLGCRVRASQSGLTQALENLHHIVIIHRRSFLFL